MAATWDLYAKELLNERPQDFAALILPGSRYVGRRESQYQMREIRLDRLVEVEREGQRILINVEIQASQDKKIARRLVKYSLAALEEYELPVLSCVIYLQRISDTDKPPWCLSKIGDRCWNWLDCISIELAEKTTEELRQMNLLGLLPLFILSKDGRSFEVLDEVTSRLNDANELALLAITRMFAEVAFPSRDERARIDRRFAMLQDIEQTPTYQRLVQQGRAEGLAEGEAKGEAKGEIKGTRRNIEAIVKKSFPSLLASAKTQIERITTFEELQAFLLKASFARTEQEFKQYLLDLQLQEE